MAYRNTTETYGTISRWLHWSMALAIVAMFALGWWMVDLDYYSSWYRSAPHIHKGTGIVLFGALVFRFGWRVANPSPDDRHLTPLERRVSHIVHWAFYGLLLALMTSGYLISTADGRPIDVFGLFQVPALIVSKGMEDISGEIHEILAYVVIGLAVVHGAAALKHHFVDRDVTLRRMLGARYVVPGSPKSVGSDRR